jgi:lipase chaperone LimK
MKSKTWLLMAILVAVVVLTTFLYTADQPSVVALVAKVQFEAPTLAVTSIVPSSSATPATAPPESVALASSREVIAGQEASDTVVFKVDTKGRIVTDEAARINIEKLFALNTTEALARKQRVLEESLPANAARELADLVDRYTNYAVAQRQTLPPGQEPASAAEGLTQIDVLHGLRVQYFGAAAAEGFFGEEEKIQRELLQLMSLEKDQSLTLAEKADKAQALYKNLPVIAAAEARGQREADAARTP